MRWLHLSDIHFASNLDGATTIQIRDKLVEYLSKNEIKADCLFITGDFRYAKTQKDTQEAADAVAEYIKKIAKTVGVDNVKKIFLVPGNHDLDRNRKLRKSLIIGIIEQYDINQGCFDNEDLFEAVEAFTFFFKICKSLYGEAEAETIHKRMSTEIHLFSCQDDYNVLLLNTSVCCVKDNEEGTLIIGTKYVIEALKHIQEINPGKPIFAIAHHGLRMLNHAERKRLLSILRDYGVNLLLCGHEHEIWHEPLTQDLYQINMGCIKQDSNVQIGFSSGILDVQKAHFLIQAHLWDSQFSRWGVYPQFGLDNEVLKIWINTPFAKAELFSSLPEMFSDVEEYIIGTRIQNQTIYGYGFDLQVVLPWIEKLMQSNPLHNCYKILVQPRNIDLNKQTSVKNAFNLSTIENSLSRLDEIKDELLQTSNQLEVREALLPYAFHGLFVNKQLYFTWSMINENNYLSNQMPIYRITCGINPLQDNFANSFSSWFSYYWEHSNILFSTETPVA